MKPGSFKIIARRIYGPAAIILVLVMSSQLAGCSAWKDRIVSKADSVVLKQEQTETEVTIKSEQKVMLHSTHSDSLKEGYWIRIIPEGEFSYSPEEGFTGRASSVQIAGNRDRWHYAVASAEGTSNVAFDSMSNRSVQSKKRMETKTKEKVPARTSSWGIVPGIVLVLTLFFICRKLEFGSPTRIRF